MAPSQKQSLSDRGGSSSSSSKGKTSTGDELLDVLVEVFPQVNLLTLIEVCMEYKNDIDGAAEYIVYYVLPSILDDSNANADGDLHIKGPASMDDNAHLDSVQFDMADKYTAENKDSIMGENLMQSPHVASSGHDRLLEDNSSDCLVASTQNSLAHDEIACLDNQFNGMHCSNHLIGEYGDEQLQCSSYEKKHETSVFDDDLSMHDDGLSDMTMQSNYSASLESLDKAIANENDIKVTLMSDVAAISQMLEVTELKEAKTKQVVSEASQAGNDILVKVDELKEMTMLAAEENTKVEGEVFAEQSILASETQGLQARLFNISEERNNYFTIIQEMHNTLQRRLLAAEMECIKAEEEKIERETMAGKILNEQELLLDAANERSKNLEQQALENAKLRELLIDRGQVVDALQGEMLGIFHNISQLQCRVNMQLPKPMQVSSSMCSSIKSTNNIAPHQRIVDEPQLIPIDELMQRASPRLSSSAKSADNIAQAQCRADEPRLPVDNPVQLASSCLSNSVKSADSIAPLLGKLLDVHFPINKPLQLASSSLCSSVNSSVKSSDSVAQLQPKVDVDEPLQLPSSSCSRKSVASESSWSSAAESNSKFSGDEGIYDASSHDNFAVDDSWDVVDDEAIYLCAN